METGLGVIVLAAGLGKRMKSEKAKVLHKIDGQPMILRVLKTAAKVAGDDIIVVVGHQANEVKKTLSQAHNPIYAFQKEQLGTGHAVLTALSLVPAHIEKLLILYGDVPLLAAKTVKKFVNFHNKEKCDISILAVESPDPEGYGRVVLTRSNMVKKIIEEADATCGEKKIKLINTGIYCVDRNFLMDSAQRLKPDNTQKEYYLTDIIEMAYKEKQISRAFITTNIEETRGINSREELLIAEAILKKRRRKIS